ncbi:G-beta repeat protein [Blumeria hordei DH14]|uniref:G-beta repeat protein n=1 Tax=Blumeria graminis f. sp. hordei (strain DH14) TaxID=546991 RepID=N1JIA3_BLUG1|nr:G-beta repeat protein [Blumeria hordei DH14]
MSAEKIIRKHSIKASSIHTPACPGKRVYDPKPAFYVEHKLSPCTATASMFVYSQGNIITCAQRDTLIVEQRFLQHTEEVRLLEADTVSGRGDGKLVVSYDSGKTAIVWDCTTGDEMARFYSQENLTVAAWMRNGNIVFGDELGNVILFELSTSENLYVKTIDQVSITALAPAVDCRTFAIGFSNGSLYIATLQPCFTVLHDLTKPKITTSITTLAWHASSPRQKSVLLATQYCDGNLRIWSIPKYHICTETAKVMRILQRTDKVQNGPHWSAWSKNGRIIQFCERETWSWDVRTKNVTYEAVPTPDIIKGLAIYGPGAILFTLSHNNSVQQFNLKSSPHIVASVQHSTNRIPLSIQIPEEKERRKDILKFSDERGTTNMQTGAGNLGGDQNEIITASSSSSRENYGLEDSENYTTSHSEILSPISVRSQVSKTSRSSCGLQNISNMSRDTADETSISTGSSLHSSQGYSLDSSRGSISPSSSSSRSNNSLNSPFKNPYSHHKARQNHIQPSDLFKYTNYRLFNVVDRQQEALDTSKLSSHDCRRQMLRIIFGWDGEAEGLIEDEISRQPFGSVSRFLLAKWLGEIDINIMSPMSESMTYSDWMLLALCGINGASRHEKQNKIARAYVQRLLREGDIHTAATFMISLGDKNDAIEIYVSHKRYMEALILTCYVFPADWQRQAQLIRKWGEWAVQHSQHNLAIKCFSCTVSEFTQPWYSPGYHGNRFSTLQTEICMQSPPESPSSAHEPQTSNTKTSALKLITSFEGASGKISCSRINEHEKNLNDTVSSLSESEFSHVASLRSEPQSAYNTPASERTATPGGFQRQRLPSIGEMHSDNFPLGKADNPTKPNFSKGNSETLRNQVHKLHEAVNFEKPGSKPKNFNAKIPMIQRSRNFLIAPLSLSASLEPSLMSQAARNISESFDDPKNDKLEISWPPMEDIITGDYMTSPGSSIASSRCRNEKQNSVDSLVKIASKPPEIITPRSEREDSHSDLVQTDNLAPTSQIIDYYIDALESAQYQFKNGESQDLKLKNSRPSEFVETSTGKSKFDGFIEDRESSVTQSKKNLESSLLFSKATAGNLPDFSSNSPSNNKAHLNTRNQVVSKRRPALKSSFSQDTPPSLLNDSSWIKPEINATSNNGIRLFPDTDKVGEDKKGKGNYCEMPSSLMKSVRHCDNDKDNNEKYDFSDEGLMHSDDQNYIEFPSNSRNVLRSRGLGGK